MLYSDGNFTRENYELREYCRFNKMLFITGVYFFIDLRSRKMLKENEC